MLNVQLVVGRVRVHGRDGVDPDDLLLHRPSLGEPVLRVVVDWPGGRSLTPRSVGTWLVACRQSNTFAMPT